MKKNLPNVPRRLFLKGIGGVTLGLPLLDALEPRRALAAEEPLRFALFVVGANGVAMADPSRQGETEMFWPTKTGALTKESLEADDTQSKRTVGMFAPYASRLLVVRGVDQPYGSAGCDHQSGDNMCLTSAKIIGSGNTSLAGGESIDNRIARERNAPGRDPVTLRAGWRPDDGTGYDNAGFLSYKGASQPRAAEKSPLKAYQRMVGMGTNTGTEAQAALALQRTSVNDILRTQIRDLMANPALSADDRERLQQHLEMVRDMEVTMSTAALDAAAQADLAAVDRDVLNMNNHPKVVRLHLALLAFAVSSGYSVTGTLKIGDRIDSHQWTVDGTKLPQFHMISHRNMSDAAGGATIPNAFELHRQIDRIHAADFLYLCDLLQGVSTPTGPLIDQGYAVWTNQISTGWHRHDNQPFVIVGSSGGYLKTGQYVDAGGVKLNMMLNTLLNAAGVKGADGAPVTDFGEPSLPKGTIASIIA
ncbi:MAG TPA: DUF1552 domain-containing protein [Polyangiaceae bacterium]